MQPTVVTTVGAPLTIVGKDLDIGATFNADVTLGAGKLRAGRIMKYTAATKELSASVDGTAPFGLLADDFDDTGATTNQPAMVYREGTFLRQEIESANNFAIAPGSAIETGLVAIGIDLEYSYDAYVGLSPVPASGGVVFPMEAVSEEEQKKLEKEAEEKKKQERENETDEQRKVREDKENQEKQEREQQGR
jgi:hypothetical protein